MQKALIATLESMKASSKLQEYLTEKFTRGAVICLVTICMGINPQPRKTAKTVLRDSAQFYLILRTFKRTMAYIKPRKSIMQTLSASAARINLYRLIDETASSHQPVLITGKRGNAVLISQEDWSAIQETLILVSIPNMRESIRDGMNTPTSELSAQLDW